MKRWLFVFVLAAATVACSQNMEPVRDGLRLDDLPPRAAPRAGGSAVEETAGEDGEIEIPPFVKAFFMHTWVEALYSIPANQNPNPNWSSPLIDAVDGRVWCTDCHISGQVNFANIPKQRIPMVDVLESDHEFMADLMRKWVARLNSDDYFAKAKLTGTVTCLTCHETHPDP